LIKKTYRPPNYETPVNYFNMPFTPNNRFFVRYHNAVIPEVKIDEWRLRIGGDAVRTPLELTLDQLRKDFKQVEIAALCLCSGNRRGEFQPHVPGIQWGSGAMGNALWRGVRLKDVLAKAGIDKSALEVSLDGADSGVLKTTPDFVKSLPLAKALDDNTLIAFKMNGEPLPHWNGFPVRLVIPGWVATYWMKHLTTINVLAKPFDGFWMKTAYRIPKERFPSGQFSSQETATNMPITEIVVNSLIINLVDGQTLPAAKPLEIKGVAWDGGNGIAKVEISMDDGISWHQATLEQDYGRFSWRQWQYIFEPKRPGECRIMARATSQSGASQPLSPILNPSGYHHNAVQNIAIQLA
jgi:DMSO/TMAO reductase YedYZ molybdopterin-dependent catalytic subunit